ncbi:uncharacterized protein LOC112566040 [Pomacea canaliculata]|uniref:uncharacterized protein LOC112566040 n=1 Tax=Pomacea canaliculata TaxID=400727 RepID=UPI000D72FBE7|nr:uncharacterized protein LOC112566040 [Pomacea canaliculata]
MKWTLGTLLCVLATLPHPSAATQENIIASGCTGEELSLQCPAGHRVALKRLFFGVKRSWDCQAPKRAADCCSATHTDCMVNDDSKYPPLNTHCSGYQQCKFVVQKVPAMERCPGSPHTDYMTVIYDCVSCSQNVIIKKDNCEIAIATFCSDDVKRGDLLFLSNVEYPSSLQEQKTDCSCMVRTSGSEGINIHSIDVLLGWAEHGARLCSKSLVIADDKGYRWDIQCGHLGFYGFRTIYSRPVNNVTLTLKSSAGKGAAFIWLQTKGDNKVRWSAGDLLRGALRQLLIRARQEVESRHRNRATSRDNTTPSVDRNPNDHNVTFPFAAHVGSLSSNLAAIIGGIVAAGFVLISIVIIAVAFHCRRVQQAKEKPKPIVLYPAVTDESTNLTSYCRYDYDDDHYSSINRSPLKMSSLTDCDIATHHARTNGFVTLATAEAHHHQHQNQPNHTQYYNHVNPTGVVTTASVTPLDHGVDSNYLGQDDSGDGQVILRGAGTLSGARDSLLADPAYNGHLSLRYTRHNGNVHQPSGTEVHDGHKTLPDNRSKILVTGPKSPLGKRSKSVTFSQPVAMVTPLPSGSEESMEADNQIIKPPSPTCSLEDGNYDNLNKVFIPDHPISPTQAHTVPILRPTVLIPQQCYNGPYPPSDQKSPPLPALLCPPSERRTSWLCFPARALGTTMTSPLVCPSPASHSQRHVRCRSQETEASTRVPASKTERTAVRDWGVRRLLSLHLLSRLKSTFSLESLRLFSVQSIKN